MRPVFPAVLLGTMLTFFSAGRSTRAATVAALPTPTPAASPTNVAPRANPTRVGGRTPRVPVAAGLLARMRAAVARRGSVHVDFLMVSALYPAGEVTTHLQGDVSWKFNLLHDRTTALRTDAGHAGEAPLQTIDLRLVHQRAASHNLVGGWQCENLVHVRVMSTLLGLEETVVSGRIVGSTVVNGNPVWELRATGYSPATGTGNLAHIMYDISQTDDTLQHIEVTGTSSLEGRTQQIVASETYTRYGEPVNVHLPAACSLR